MLMGLPPFGGETSQRLVARHVIEEPPRLRSACPTVPAGMDAAVWRALPKSPADRFATVTDFAVALQQEATAAPRATPFPASAPVVTNPKPTTADPTIAVLYLENLSPDAADAYLADGLTEEITSRLAAVPRLVVKGRSAVRRFRGTDVGDPTEVGRELRVQYLLEGSLRRSGARVRVSVRLLRTESGMRVWGADYDRDTVDLLALQEDIARQLVGNMAGTLLPADEQVLVNWPTRFLEAYDHFLRGRGRCGALSALTASRGLVPAKAAVETTKRTPAGARFAAGSLVRSGYFFGT